MTTAEHKCEASVAERGGWHSHPCGNKAVVKHNGVFLCRVHAKRYRIVIPGDEIVEKWVCWITKWDELIFGKVTLKANAKTYSIVEGNKLLEYNSSVPLSDKQQA